MVAQCCAALRHVHGGFLVRDFLLGLQRGSQCRAVIWVLIRVPFDQLCPESIWVELSARRDANARRLVPPGEECLRERHNHLGSHLGLHRVLQCAGHVEISLRLIGHHEWSAVAEALRGLMVGQVLRGHLRQAVIVWLPRIQVEMEMDGRWLICSDDLN